MKLIVCRDNQGGIAKEGKIPWNIPADRAIFKYLTDGSIVVMGWNTWLGIFEAIKKPLPNRRNIIISARHTIKDITFNNAAFDNASSVEFFKSPEEFVHSFYVKENIKLFNSVWIIGGKEIYEWFLKAELISEIWDARIYVDYECDIKVELDFDKFIYEAHDDAVLRRLSAKAPSEFHLYKYKLAPNGETKYLDLMEEILNFGSERDDRTGTGTLAEFGKQFEFDLYAGKIPLLTTKFVNWRSVILELLWFLRGDTDSKILERDGVKIWRGNTSREFLDKCGLGYREGDVGPMYGWQWRHYGADYYGCDVDYTGQGIDQLAELINEIKTNPTSRRLLLSTYDVENQHKGVLYPCHGLIVQFFCDGQKLSCHMYQRSMDIFLGAPFNFASYGILTHLIAAKTGMTADKLIISTGDVHIYKNLIEQCKIQTARTQYPFPQLRLSPECATKDWDELILTDFEIFGYQHWPLIKGQISI